MNTSESPFQCTTCLEDTVEFEHECYACPLSLVALNAILQEEELQAEIRDQELRQIECECCMYVCACESAVCVCVYIYVCGVSD